jgi:3-oxoacyl-[acyl-carrier-protein] synthase II
LDRDGEPGIRQALANAMRAALKEAGLTPADVGHINAHGLGSPRSDVEEARAIHDVFGNRASEVPVTAIKSYFGNAGAGCGTLELAASLLALQHGVVPKTLNFETPDPECPLNVVHGEPLPASNKVVLKTNVTRMGQASAVVLQGA